MALRCLALDVASDARRTADLSTTLRSVEKHSQERSAELQIPPLRYAPVGMTNLCVQVNLSSRPERSVVERSAVLLSSLRVGHRFRGLNLPPTLQHLLLHLPVGTAIQAFPQDQQIKSNFNQAIPHPLGYFCLVTA